MSAGILGIDFSTCFQAPQKSTFKFGSSLFPQPDNFSRVLKSLGIKEEARVLTENSFLICSIRQQQKKDISY